MKKLIALVMTLSVLAGTTALADGSKDKKPAPKNSEKKATAKLTDVWTCAMTGEAVTDKKAKGYTVGTYRVHFCCPGCDTQFFKLSKTEQIAKAKAAAEKKKG